jgi:hypothetical protein
MFFDRFQLFEPAAGIATNVEMVTSIHDRTWGYLIHVLGERLSSGGDGAV